MKKAAVDEVSRPVFTLMNELHKVCRHTAVKAVRNPNPIATIACCKFLTSHALQNIDNTLGTVTEQKLSRTPL